MNRLHCPDCGIPTIEDTDSLGLSDDEIRCEKCYQDITARFERIQGLIDNCEEDTLSKITSEIQAGLEHREGA